MLFIPVGSPRERKRLGSHAWLLLLLQQYHKTDPYEFQREILAFGFLCFRYTSCCVFLNAGSYAFNGFSLSLFHSSECAEGLIAPKWERISRDCFSEGGGREKTTLKTCVLLHSRPLSLMEFDDVNISINIGRGLKKTIHKPRLFFADGLFVFPD